jgi:hypothetical protein
MNGETTSPTSQGEAKEVGRRIGWLVAAFAIAAVVGLTAALCVLVLWLIFST